MPVQNVLLELVARQGNFGLLFIGVSSFMEYVFPPYPGDLIVLFGAALLARGNLSPWATLAVVLVGSACGCMATFYVGRLLMRSETRWTRGVLARARPQIDEIIERFGRHGSLYLTLNRFLPSIRWLFFIAAGMARLPPSHVLFWGLLSAGLWNGLLLFAGLRLGHNWAAVERLVEVYREIAWAVIAGIVLTVATYKLLSRSKHRRKRS
jgi:membrane protein DedA with SNARE-associated domain